MPRPRRGVAKKTKPRKKTPASEEGWFTIRRILDERTTRGCVEYLVDWDDNAVTGETYDPTWSKEVTDTAKEEWEAQKTQVTSQDAHPGPATQDTDYSQSPRPANWRQLSRLNVSGRKRPRSTSCSSQASSFGRPSKKLHPDREESIGTHGEAPGLSVASTPSSYQLSDHPEPTEGYRASSQPQVKAVIVAINIDPEFDPSEYLSVKNSQDTQQSLERLSELEDEDRVLQVLPPSQHTIADSQEVSDLSLSHLHLQQISTSSLWRREGGEVDLNSVTSSVIPDSTELPPQQSHAQSRDPTSNRNANPTLSSRATPIDQLEEAQIRGPDSPESNIPSRQLDLQGFPVAAEASVQVSGEPATTLPAIHDFSQSSLEDPLNRSNQELQQTHLVCLTQPPPPLSFPVPESSLSGDLNLPQSSPPSASPAVITPRTRIEEDRTSQAAQIIELGTNTVDQQNFTASTNSVLISTSQTADGNSAKDIFSDPRAYVEYRESRHRKAKEFIEAVFSSLVEETSTPSRALRSSPAQSDNMDQLSQEEASSRRVSTVREELSQIFDMDLTIPCPASKSPTSIDPPEALDALLTTVPAGIQAEVDLGVAATSTEVPLRSSDAPIMDSAPDWLNDLSGAVSDTAGAQAIVLDPVSGSIPDSATVQPSQTVHQELQAIIDSAWSTPIHPTPIPTTAAQLLEDVQPVTVSLADITRQIVPEHRDIPLMPSLALHGQASSSLDTTSSASITMAQAQRETESPESSPTPQERADLTEYVVTLPFQSSLRPTYDSTLLEFKRQITEFGNVFSNELYREPDASLTDQINQLFNRLHNICDYPQDLFGSNLEDLPPLDQVRFCRDANSKFSFVFELLQSLERNIKVLIIARSVPLLRLLSNVAITLQLDYQCEAIGKSSNDSELPSPQVTLALPTEEFTPNDFELVIGFDHSFSDSAFAQRAECPVKPQLALVLVTTHSLEHIELEVPEDLNAAERMNVLLSAVVRARKLITDPDRDMPEPHEVAPLFIDFLKGRVDDILWEPIPIPDNVLDVYVNSQAKSQFPAAVAQEPDAGRKRKLDDSDDSEVKRIRVQSRKASTVEQPPLSDEIQELLAAASPQEQTTIPQTLVQVPLSVLESLAEKFAESKRQIEAAQLDNQYKAIIKNYEKRMKDYERTSKKAYETQRSALRDRSQFEAEKRKVETSLQNTVENAKRDAEKAHNRISELERIIARLTENSDASDPQGTPLAKSEKLLQEAQAKILTLEKRVENAQQAEEYVRSIYQDASSAAAALKAENTQLRAENDELQKKSTNSVGQVHKIQEESTTKALLSRINELKALVMDREGELDRTREELKQLKSGRRETRQVSVPRSPRMGMMSPRTGRGYGSASRGTSPASAVGVEGGGVPGMQFLGQQSGNGRWQHLRD